MVLCHNAIPDVIIPQVHRVVGTLHSPLQMWLWWMFFLMLRVNHRSTGWQPSIQRALGSWSWFIKVMCLSTWS